MATQKQLLSCSWNAKVLGFSKSTLSSIGGLLRHLTFSCLVTTNISYHIQLLERALDANDVKARLFSPFDIQYLTGCAMQLNGKGLERYCHDHTCKTLCQFGSELSSGSISQFGGITHVNNSHWIAFIISPRESTIFLADSLHWPVGNNGPPTGVKAATATLQWWLNTSYSGSNQSVSPFRIERLPIAYQKDFSSCGIFALNALMHHLIPSRYSLCSDDMVMIRVELLASILDHHAAQVSESSATVTKLRLTTL
jgi:hypothetical protein